jgi:isoquinoline 1-oxidoreductase beta subunit
MNATPRIDVEIVQSNAPSGGVGEAGTAGLGAAFANAIFAATGKRVDTLPVRPDQLKEGA